MDPRYEGSNLNPYFLNDLDWLMNNHKPDAWFFGHTHTAFDKLHSNEKTRLVCNPRGYPGEKADSFEWKILEV